MNKSMIMSVAFIMSMVCAMTVCASWRGQAAKSKAPVVIAFVD